jgi:hypothetical protein
VSEDKTLEALDPAPSNSNRRAEFLAYAVTLVLALAFAFLVLQLWRADLAVPFAYEHDSFPILTWTKTMLDNGWWLTNKYLGAPAQFEMHDYPTNCNLHFAVLKCLSFLSSDPAVLVNLYFILSFPLISLAALTALRSLNVSRAVAMVGSILYAFLPYHFWRGESHLFLSTYYLIPLVCLVIVWIAKGEPFLIVRQPETRRLHLELTSTRAVCSVLICAALGCDFPYYPIFASLFLVVAGIYTFAHSRSASTLLKTAILTGVLSISFLGNMSPSFLYWWRNGPNLSPHHVAKRPWTDAETLSLTVTQLLLPADHHRLPVLGNLRDRFYSATRLVSEADAMVLGTIGSMGFLLLMGGFVCGHRSRSERGQRYHLFSVLTICALLVCTAGGFGTAFNLLGFGMVRCYNRISIFIGFLALAAIIMGIDLVYQRFAQRRGGLLIGRACLAVLLVLGIADQTGQTYLVPFSTTKETYQSDADFVARIEASVPENSMVFQMPYIAFLSYANACHQMLPYSHFRGYLHSHTLRWSFGAMHGRFGDNLHAQLANLPIECRIRELAFLGFAGIYVDRYGYADSAKELETQLRNILDTEPIVSRNGRLSFFSMADFNQRLKQGYTDEEWQKQHDFIYHSPQARWQAGFYLEETAGPDRWRWCGTDGTLQILNPADRTQRVSLRFVAKTCLPGAATLSIKSAGFSEQLAIDAPGSTFVKTLEIPPGPMAIHFHCTALPFLEPSRTLVFGIYNFRLEEVEDLVRSP